MIKTATRIVGRALFGRPPKRNEIVNRGQLAQPLPGEDENLKLHVDACTRRYESLWVAQEHTAEVQEWSLDTQRVIAWLLAFSIAMNLFRGFDPHVLIRWIEAIFGIAT